MWWRCVAAAGLLTIYLLCVLLLSGLQKDDLDMGILDKLRRHNINMDFAESENIIKKCAATYGKKSNGLRKMIYNKSPKNNRTIAHIDTETKNSKYLSNITNLLSLLSKLTTESKPNATTSLPTTTTAPTTKINEPSMDYISKIIENYIAQTKALTTTQAPTTIDIKSMMEAIKQILLNKETQQTTKAYTTTEATTKKYDNDDWAQILKKALKEIDSKDNQQNVTNSSQSNLAVEIDKSSRRAMNNEPPKKVVEDIAKNVKDIVLQQLRKELHNLTTTSTARYKESDKSTKRSINDVTLAFVEFMELFKQFKAAREGPSVQQTTQTSNEPKPSAILFYTQVVPAEVYKPLTPPSNRLSYIPQVIHDVDVPIQINKFNTKQYQHIPEHRIAQVNIYDKEHAPLTMQTNRDEIPPLKIRALEPDKIIYQNIVVTTEQPPYHRFVSQKNTDYLYGNPIEHKNIDNRMHMYPAHEMFREYSLDKMRPHNFYDYVPLSDIPIMHNKYSYGRARDLKSKYRDYYMKKDHHRSTYDDERYGRNYERGYGSDVVKFHEKLEKVDDYSSRDTEQSNERFRTNKKIKITTRNVRPLHEDKNHSKYDDTHFKNFLETQQKVNDMLERILATKNFSDKPTSDSAITA